MNLLENRGVVTPHWGHDPRFGNPSVFGLVWFGLVFLSLRVFVYFDCGAGLWDDAIGCLAVVDVLATLAAFSRAGDQPSVCRPKILAPAGAADAARLRMVQVSNKPGAGRQQRASPRRSEANLLCVFFCRAVQGVHPCHSQLMVGAEFIANDVYLGCSDDGRPAADCLKLVTGPNMGGKSTLMRQVSLSRSSPTTATSPVRSGRSDPTTST